MRDETLTSGWEMPTDVAWMQAIVDGLGGVLFKFPFRVPAYYALILRSLTVLEGLALQADKNYKLLGKAYPYMAKRLLIDPAPELRSTALKSCKFAMLAVWLHVST